MMFVPKSRRSGTEDVKSLSNRGCSEVVSEHQRIVRSALWAAYGDALGFISELTDRNGLRHRIERETVDAPLAWRRNVGGRFGATVELPAGCYSDDTQLRLATSRAIRRDGYFDVEAFAKIELPVWLCYALGAGRSTRAAATQLARRDVNWFSNFFQNKGQRYEDAGGNGAAMRVQPHVWAAKDKSDHKAIAHDVVRNALCTHGHPRAIIGALFHSLCLSFALAQHETPSPKHWREMCALTAELCDRVASDDDLRSFWLPVWEKKTGIVFRDAVRAALGECVEDIDVIERHLSNRQFSYVELVRSLGGMDEKSRGSGTKTAIIAAVLAWIYREDTPRRALQTAVNALFSDTDTISSMTGAILGCLVDHEPSEEILDREYIVHQARRLSDISMGKDVDDFPYPDVMEWDPPQSQLEVVKQTNGYVVSGLGTARTVGNSFVSRSSQDIVWQWLRLDFGQSILAKRRARIEQSRGEQRVSPQSSPERIESGSREARQSHQGRTLPLFDPQGRDVGVETKARATLDEITADVIRSGFDERLIGRYLLRLASDERGIELAIAFAAIVAKARMARLKGPRQT